MYKFKSHLFIVLVFIISSQSVQGQVSDNFTFNHSLDSGTFSYRVVENDCSSDLTPTWTFYDRTSWDSSPYTEGYIKYKFNSLSEPFVRGGQPRMNYRLLPPNGYDSSYSEGYPMILMLHGFGERANCWGSNCYYPGYNSGTRPQDCADTLAVNSRFRNNDHNLVHGGRPHLDAVNLAGTLKAEDPSLPERAFPGFVLFPQNMNGWVGTDVDQAYMIIRLLMDSLNIDPNRIYVHGLSNGGEASWNIIQKYPSIFAAALPMSGDFTPNNVADSTVHHPMWIFQGGQDTRPSPAETASRIKKYEEAGGIVRYTEYPSLGHGTWNSAYAEPDFFSWILKHNKANMHVYYGDSTFCSTDNKGVRLGVAQGFKAYQWRKDGVIMPDSTDRDIIVYETGTYEVRFSRVSANPASEAEWNRWSDPVEIKERSAETPIILASGSTVLPDLNGQDSVYLFGPEGFGYYDWYKDDVLVANPDTTFFKLSSSNDAGDYSLIVKTLDGCPSLQSGTTSVLNNAPININTPGDFVAIPISSTAVQLLWNDLSLNEYGFEIYRTTTPGLDYTFVALTPSDQISFTDTGLDPNTIYFYQLRAVSSSGRSNYFLPEISVTTLGDATPPSTPQNVTVLSNTVNSVSLSWDASTDNSGIQDYYVYFGSDSVSSQGALEVTVSGLTINNYFTFTVKAVDVNGNFSSDSNPVHANTIISGLYYEHSTGAWNNLGEIDWDFVEFSGDIDNFDISGTTQADFFNFRFTGYLFIETGGDYDFRLYSDDGSRLIIDGIQVVDYDGLHGCGNVITDNHNLAAGPHPIEVIFFERTGGQCLTVQYRGADTGDSWVNIPDSALKSGTVVAPDPAPPAPTALSAIADASVPLIDLSWSYSGEGPENLNIVVLGSSTAFGTGASNYSNSWVGLLDTWLTSNTTNHTLTNLALGGFETYDIRPTGSLPAPDNTKNITAALALEPDIILINLPSNNVASNVPIPTTMDHYREIKAIADAAGVKVYLTTTQPRNFGTNGVKRALLEEEADSVRANFGKFVIDIYDSLTDFSDDRRIKNMYNSGDGIHLNDDGHAYIFNTALSTLSEELTNFQILRSTVSGGPYELVSTTVNANQAYTDSLLNPATTYYYVARTINLNGTSTDSNEAFATTVVDVTPPSDPANLAYHAANFSQISLTWDASTDNIGVSGYEIYKDNILIDSSATSNYIATGLIASNNYDFRVRAYDASGNFSNYSNTINVSTLVTVVYYLKSTGTPTDLSSWDTAINGNDGIQPQNFTNNGQYFTIVNQTPAILNSDWTVEGNISKVIVENGEILDINSNFSGTIEGKAGSTVNLNSASSPSFINMDATSQVNFGSQNTNIPMASYGNINLLGSSSIKVFGEGETVITGNFVSNNGVTIKGAPNNGSLIKIEKNSTINGLGITPVDNRASLIFNGTTPQNLSTDGDLLFYKLGTENGADVVFNGPANAVITLGSLNGGGIDAETGSSLDLSYSKIVIANAGTINATNQTGQLGLDSARLVFSSSSTVNSNLYPLSGKNSIWTIDYNAPSSTQLIIQGDSLKVKNYVDITQGIINSNGFLKLLSETDSTSSYIKNLSSGGQVVGNVTAQRHMEGEGKLWRYISSPVVGATVEQLQNSIPITGLFTGASTGYTNNASMFYYDESIVGNEWVNFPDNASSNQEILVTGQGYGIWIREATLATVSEVTGPLNQGDIVITPLAEGAVNDGWNLIGNPYASPIKWAPSDPSAWNMIGITNSIAVPDNGEGSGGGGYHYWDGSIGSLTDGIIAPWQAFWIQTTTASPSLTITENAKYDSIGATFYRVADNPHFVEIKLSDGTLEDLAYIKFVTESTDDYDKNEDAFKRHNTYFNLSSLSADSIALAINVVKDYYCTKTIQLNIADTEPGQYAISFDLVNGMRFDESYTLYDSYLDETIKLNFENNYQFDITSDSATFNSRFSLIIEKGEITQADIDVSSLTEPILSIQGDSLVSSYSGVNQWYLNDFLIEGSQGSSFIPTESGDYIVSVNEGLCMLYSASLNFIVTGLGSINDNPDISIYPNPLGRGMPLNLKGRDFSKVTEILILSGTGKIVSNCNYQVVNENTIEIELSNSLSPGLYYLYLKYEEKTSVKKFILRE